MPSFPGLKSLAQSLLPSVFANNSTTDSRLDVISHNANERSEESVRMDRAKREPEKTDTANEPPPKRHKKSPADDLICPITLELLFNPVMAEDGRIYEKSAINEYFKSSESTDSPYTGEPMGKRLLPAPQVKNLIETLVENGCITSDLSDKWQEEVQKKIYMEDLQKKAGQGDVDSMVKLAIHLRDGSGGFKKNWMTSYEWMNRARAGGSALATAVVGEALVYYPHLYGVERNSKLGIVYLAMGAGYGSDSAAYLLGHAFVHGSFGVEKDEAEGLRLLKKCLNDSSIKHLTADGRAAAQNLFNEVSKRAAK